MRASLLGCIILDSWKGLLLFLLIHCEVMFVFFFYGFKNNDLKNGENHLLSEPPLDPYLALRPGPNKSFDAFVDQMLDDSRFEM